MSVDLRKTIEDLRSLVDALKVRCSLAETRLQDRENEIVNLKAQVETGKTQLSKLTEKYESLKMGMVAADADGLSQMKDNYLALVREIDDCIRLMQYGR